MPPDNRTNKYLSPLSARVFWKHDKEFLVLALHFVLKVLDEVVFSPDTLWPVDLRVEIVEIIVWHFSDANPMSARYGKCHEAEREITWNVKNESERSRQLERAGCDFLPLVKPDKRHGFSLQCDHDCVHIVISQTQN